jgi:hypothetical protein
MVWPLGSELVFGLVGAVACLAASDVLGRIIIKSSASVLGLAMGWCMLALWATTLASVNMLKPWLLVLSVLSICGYGFLSGRLTCRVNLRAITTEFRSSPWKWCFLLSALLMAVRMARGLLPIENWDSVNHHLPLLLERLYAGHLEPLFNVATDRRTPLGGVMLKCYPMAFDSSGRALVVMHIGLVGLVFYRVYKAMAVWHPEGKRVFVLSILMLMPLSDLWVYIGMAGDEPWFLMLAMVWVELFLWPKPQLSVMRIMLSTALLIMGLCIKATAVFFLVPAALAGAIFFWRQWKGLVLGLCLGMGCVIMCHSWSLRHYGMIYPLQRWSNLLETQEPVHLFTAKEVSVGRQSLGLSDHRDNHGALDAPAAKWWDNLSRAHQWPLGPYGLWLCCLIWTGIKLKRSPLMTMAGLFLGSCALGLSFAMASWSFSTQAITRYLLPLWIWGLLGLSMVFAQKTAYILWIRRLIFLLLLSATFLESKVLWFKAQASFLDNAQVAWEKRLLDGPLLKRFRELNVLQEKTFYMGCSAVLLAGEGNWLAQVGNEVGWREPEQLAKFLKQNQISWWVLANSAEKYDAVYGKLTEEAERLGLLDLVEADPLGKIYRVK